VDFKVGRLYKVKSGHEFHSNRIGRFEFLGGPQQDVAVFTDLSKSTSTHEEMFATGLNDVEEVVKEEAIRLDEDTALKAAEGKTFVSSSLTASA